MTVLIVLAVALGACAATMTGGLLALKLAGKLPLVMGFSAGAVIGVAFFDLAPEALDAGKGLYEPRTLLTIAALGFFGAILFAGFTDGERVIGFAFIGVAAAVSLYAVSFLISNGGWQAVFICLIIAAGFGAFGVGTVLLTQPAADAAAAIKDAGEWR